ncbi:MAG: DMT family transporter [Marinilabiliaceae bacterium]|jgi:drug/metabolite transporter (DMT)-like permease|nr:DMT family transporter [Marinilabiliaceae bacterium]
MTNTRRSYLFAGLAVFFWSTIATAFKLALQELLPAQLLLIASLTSVLVLSVISLLEGSFKKIFSLKRKDLLRSMLLGTLNPFIYYLVLLEAYNRLPAQVAQPLNMIWPIVLVFLSIPMLKQKVPPASFIALFVSFIGVYLISSQGKPFNPGESDALGVILAVGSSIFWALYFILNLKDSRGESQKLLLSFFFASIYISLLLLFNKGYSGFTLRGITAGIYVGIFEMGLTFFLWLKAMKLADSSDKIANLVFLAPFLSLLFISLILKENIHYTTLIGLLVIIGSIIYQKRLERKS